MKKLLVIASILIFQLSGCLVTNQFLFDEGKSGTKATLPVSLDTLIKMGEYSKLIYTDADIFADGKVSPDEPEFYGMNLMIDEQYRIEDDAYSYYVDQSNDNFTVLIFRGTANTENILDDINMMRFYDEGLGLKLHTGFRDAANLLYRDIRKSYELDHKVILTGHSLGGAIAQIIGMWLDMRGYDVQVFTFGSPKVSTTFIHTKLAHYRVVDPLDPVPFFPWFPYVHSGTVIDVTDLSWSENHEEGAFTDTDGSDHSIVDYLDILYNQSECNAKCRGSKDIRE